MLSLGLALVSSCRKAESPPAPVQMGEPVLPIQPISPGEGRTVSIELGEINRESGVVLRFHGDGKPVPVSIDGVECRLVESKPDKNYYFYFAVDPDFKRDDRMDVAIVVEYLDKGEGHFILQYDASSTNRSLATVYLTLNEAERLTDSGKWKKGYFLARRATFRNSQNGQSDFRLELRTPELFVRRVSVIRLDLP